MFEDPNVMYILNTHEANPIGSIIQCADVETYVWMEKSDPGTRNARSDWEDFVRINWFYAFVHQKNYVAPGKNYLKETKN